jgi:hypothetical protein
MTSTRKSITRKTRKRGSQQGNLRSFWLRKSLVVVFYSRTRETQAVAVKVLHQMITFNLRRL